MALKFKCSNCDEDIISGFTLILASLIVCGLMGIGSVCLATGGKWEKKTDMPTERFGHSASVVDGKIYVIGGAKLDWTPLSIVEVYDPASDTWEKKSDMPTARWYLDTAVVDGMIYAVGGAKAGWVNLSTVELYNPVSDTWEKKAAMPTARRTPALAAVNGRIYAIGGTNGVRVLETVEEYDPCANIWNSKSDMPTARYAVYAGVVDGKIYVVGGGDQHDNQLSIVEEYDPLGDTWQRREDMAVARYGMDVCVIDRKLYAIGGAIKGTMGYPPLPDVEMYDPALDRWTDGNDMPTARWGHSANAVDGKIYSIGGTSSATFRPFPLSIVEEYTPEGLSVPSQVKLTTTWGSVKHGR
jgi:N-acetylneuraminic acid mutarotase